MFEEYNNLNIGNCSDTELIALIRQTSSVVTLYNQATLELLRRFDNHKVTQGGSLQHPGQQYHAIANGCKIADEESPAINKDDFDVTLNMDTNSLEFREDPICHSPLKKADLKGIGARRIEVLKYLLEIPENMSQLIMYPRFHTKQMLWNRMLWQKQSVCFVRHSAAKVTIILISKQKPLLEALIIFTDLTLSGRIWSFTEIVEKIKDKSEVWEKQSHTKQIQYS